MLDDCPFADEGVPEAKRCAGSAPGRASRSGPEALFGAKSRLWHCFST